MNDTSTIEQTVMRRVRLIRVLVLIVSTATLALLTCGAALWGIGREVWVAHVFKNMPPVSDPSIFVTFWFFAFLNTHLVVQVLTILTLASLSFLAYEAIRFLASPSSSRR